MVTAPHNQLTWNSRFFEQGGLFDVFKPWQEWILLHAEAFPSLEVLSQLAAEKAISDVRSGGGFPIRFVRQQRLIKNQRLELGWRGNYQMRIFLSGEVPSRPQHWHDFFNAWTWIFLPQLKAAINFRHFFCLEEMTPFPWVFRGGNRNREQDLLTLFDEGGVLVVTDDDELWEQIVTRKWAHLFENSAPHLQERVVFIPVGHALFECALKGHPRLHASCIRVPLKASGLSFGSNSDWRRSLRMIDDAAAACLTRRRFLQTPDDLHALPIWGIPRWHPRSGEPNFTRDASYFRG